MDYKTENLLRARELINQLVQTNTERFMEYGFLTYRWWILLAFLIVPWVIWIKVADKKRMLEILFVGTLVIVITHLFDLVGYNLDFWDYPVELLPLVPGGMSFDLSMIPVAFMLIYQFYPTWKSYCIALLCMTVVYAFIGEPFAIRLELVIYIKWSNVYSVAFYILTGVAVKALVEKLKGMSAYVARPSKNGLR